MRRKTKIDGKASVQENPRQGFSPAMLTGASGKMGHKPWPPLEKKGDRYDKNAAGCCVAANSGVQVAEEMSPEEQTP